MLIRKAAPKDAAAIAALSSQLGYLVSSRQVAACQAALLPLEDHLILVAEAEPGMVVGWVHAFISRRLLLPPFAELGGIVVFDFHRRHGVGSALLHGIEEWALAAGCELLRIRSNTRRVGADFLYGACGYAMAKTQNVFEKMLLAGQPISHSERVGSSKAG
jgi:GNAT superfamily N-acetyltransferase